MSRQVCKSKQIPRIFQRRNQSIRSVLRNERALPECINIDSNVENIKSSSSSTFAIGTTDNDCKRIRGIQRNKCRRKVSPSKVNCTTKISNEPATINNGDSIGGSLLEKNSQNSDCVADIEKWLKTRTEAVTSIDLDAMKPIVQEVDADEVDQGVNVDRYLADDLPHSFLCKDPDGLSIDIDLSDKKLNLDYDPLLRELQSDKLLEACQKNDDFIMPEFGLDNLDPLVLAPHDMMVGGEILPSTDRHNGATTTEALERDSENVDGVNRNFRDSEMRERIDKPTQEERNSGEESNGTVEPDESNRIYAEPCDRQIVEPEMAEDLEAAKDAGVKSRGRLKLQPRIIKKRRKIKPKPDKNDIAYLREPCHIDGKDSVMAVVAISTNKISNMTQIVINTGMDEQIYQGKTSELIEATGNFPKISKFEMSDGPFCTRDKPHERMVSKALEELGITDESLEPTLISENGRTWLCPRDECNREFCRLQPLKAHLLTHFGVRPFKCDYEGCTWAFHSEFKLKRHKETHLKRKNFVCEVAGCNRRFTTIYNLSSHEKLHTRPNRITCQVPDCHEKFQTKRALELHMKNHDQSHAPYSCNHEGCGKRYYTSNALTSHQRCHNYKEIDVKCSWPGCGKVFDKPCRLKAHVRSHTGSKPYCCTYQDCQWAFPSSSKLKRHQKKHTNERKFICNVEGCGKAFMRSEHLREHSLTHAGGGYFECYMCDAHFSAKSSLYVHIKKHQMRDAVNNITGSVDKVPKCKNQDNEKTKENIVTRIVTADDVLEIQEFHGNLSIQGDVTEHTGNSCVNADDIMRKTAKRNGDDLSYSCGMVDCGKSYDTLSSLASHMISSHDGSMIDDDESSIGISTAQGASDLDYILYEAPNSNVACRATALATCNTVVVNETPKIVARLPESESPPRSFPPRVPSSPPPRSSPSSDENPRLSENSYRTPREKQILDQQTRVRKSYHGSARTGLTRDDVWKLKGKINGTEVTNVVATDVVLGEANLNEGLLLTEELPSMYYQDDIVGTECQILLLDNGNSVNPIDLHGLE